VPKGLDGAQAKWNHRMNPGSKYIYIQKSMLFLIIMATKKIFVTVSANNGLQMDHGERIVLNLFPMALVVV